eukprot:403360192
MKRQVQRYPKSSFANLSLVSTPKISNIYKSNQYLPQDASLKETTIYNFLNDQNVYAIEIKSQIEELDKDFTPSQKLQEALSTRSSKNRGLLFKRQASGFYGQPFVSLTNKHRKSQFSEVPSLSNNQEILYSYNNDDKNQQFIHQNQANYENQKDELIGSFGQACQYYRRKDTSGSLSPGNKHNRNQSLLLNTSKFNTGDDSNQFTIQAQ